MCKEWAQIWRSEGLAVERNDGKKSLQMKSGCYFRSVRRGVAGKALPAEAECVLASVEVPCRTHGGVIWCISGCEMGFIRCRNAPYRMQKKPLSQCDKGYFAPRKRLRKNVIFVNV